MIALTFKRSKLKRERERYRQIIQPLYSLLNLQLFIKMNNFNLK